MNIKILLDKLNIQSRDLSIVKNAFMHASYANEHSEFENNERLEFLGDAVLQLWISQYLYSMPEHLSEGNMTTLRAQLVCESSLAQYATDLSLGDYLLLGVGEEKNAGRTRTSILADCFEAFLGAVYLTTDFVTISELLEKVIVPYVKKPKTEELVDYKTMLQEYVQADTRRNVKYELLKTEGPSNAPMFYVVVKLDEIVLGYGNGTTKKKAEQRAAQAAFEKLAI